jgi:hypothetical protein
MTGSCRATSLRRPARHRTVAHMLQIYELEGGNGDAGPCSGHRALSRT